MNEPWRITLLGGLRAQQEGRTITRFSTQKTAALLAYLAHYRDRGHPREVLIETLWPESAPEAGRASLSVALSSLRHQLEPPGVPAGAVIIADRFAVQLNPAAVTTDTAEFEAALKAAGQAGGETERAQHLARAVNLYGGQLLPGYYDGWITAEQERLAGLFFQALPPLIRYLEQTRELARAAEYARRAIAADLLREEFHRDLMHLLAAARQPAAALRQYRELERLLRAELGDTASEETRALAARLTAAGGHMPGEQASRRVPAPPAPAPQSASTNSSNKAGRWDRPGLERKDLMRPRCFLTVFATLLLASLLGVPPIALANPPCSISDLGVLGTKTLTLPSRTARDTACPVELRSGSQNSLGAFPRREESLP